MPRRKKSFKSYLESVKSYSHWQSVLVIVVVAAVGIAASQALFRDIEQSQKGTFVVGTLDLAVNDPNASGQQPQSIQIQKVGEKKEVQGEKTYELKNSGSLDGRLYFHLTNLINYENGCNEPEALVDTTCGNPGPDEGELGQNIIVEVVVGSGNDAQVVATSDLATANANQLGTQWESADPITLKAGKKLPVTLRWRSKTGSLGNEVQSDSVTFDINYELRQIVTQ